MFSERNRPWPFRERARIHRPSVAIGTRRIGGRRTRRGSRTTWATWTGRRGAAIVARAGDARPGAARGPGETPTLADYRESCPDHEGLAGPLHRRAGADRRGRARSRRADGGRPTGRADRRAARPGPDGGAARSGADPEPTTAGDRSRRRPRSGCSAPSGRPPRARPDRDGLARVVDRASPSAITCCSRSWAPAAWASSSRPGRRRLNRVVALKMIKAGILADDRHIRLFRSEAEAVAALDHPHIVPVLDSGEHQGMLYYSMKLVEGQDLSRSLGRLPGPAGGDRPAGGAGRRGDRPRPRARRPAPRPQAVEHPGRRAGRAARHRLRPGEAAGRGAGRDADGRPTRWGRPATWRPSRPGAIGTRSPRRPTSTAWARCSTALLTGRPPFAGTSADGDRPPGHRRRAAPAPRPVSPGGPRPGDHLPEVPEQGRRRTDTPRPASWPTT